MNVEDLNERKTKICYCASFDEQECINNVGANVQFKKTFWTVMAAAGAVFDYSK